MRFIPSYHHLAGKSTLSTNIIAGLNLFLSRRDSGNWIVAETMKGYDCLHDDCTSV